MRWRKSRASAWKASRVDGSPCASATARTAGSHCRYSSATPTVATATSGTFLRCASASTDGPASTPSRSAFCPNGVGTKNAPTRTPRYSSAAGPQRPAPGSEQRDARGADRQHRPERGGGEAVVAAFGEQRPEQDAAAQRRQEDPQRAAQPGAPVGDQLRRGAEHQEHARDGAGEHRAQPEHAGGPHAGRSRATAQAATPNAIPSRNGIRPIATLDSTPAVNSQAAMAPAVRDGAAAWASGGNSAVATSAAPHTDERRPEHHRQRREQQRVAEHVMPAVPLGVPDRQPLLLEQPRAIRVRGHVGGCRLDDQVRQTRQRATQRRRERVLERAPHVRQERIRSHRHLKGPGPLGCWS